MVKRSRFILGIIVIFFFIFTAGTGRLAQAEEPVIKPELEDESWLGDALGELQADQEKLTNNIEEFTLPLYFLENYLAHILPEVREPGEYKIHSLPTREGLFEIEEVEQQELQFEEQPEDWQQGDEWVWHFKDDARYVELILTSQQIDYVEEPGRPMLSRIIFELEYNTPDYTITGTINLYDDFDDLDLNIELDHFNASFDKISAEINMNLLEREEKRFRFTGDLFLPGVNSSGEHYFIMTDRPLELPRVQPLYLDEYIFKGYVGTEKFAIEGDLWICRSSIVMDGYTVIY